MRTSVSIVSLPPTRSKRLLLQHAEHLALHERGHVADLVEEHGAAVALFELADAPALGAR